MINMRPRSSRRRLLTAGGAAGLTALAGCSIRTGDLSHIGVRNETDETVEPTVVVQRNADGVEVFSETSRLPSKETVSFSHSIEQGMYTISATLTDGRTASDTWEVRWETDNIIDVWIYDSRAAFRVG